MYLKMVFYCIQGNIFNGLVLLNNVFISKFILQAGLGILLFINHIHTQYFHLYFQKLNIPQVHGSHQGKGTLTVVVLLSHGSTATLRETLVMVTVLCSGSPPEDRGERGPYPQSLPGGPHPCVLAAAGALTKAQVLASHPVEWLLLLCLASMTHA